MNHNEAEFLIELKGLFDLFSVEICESFLTEMKEFELNYGKELFTTFLRENFEHYLDLRKGVNYA